MHQELVWRTNTLTSALNMRFGATLGMLLLAIGLSACNATPPDVGLKFQFENSTPYVLRVVKLGVGGENDSSRQQYVPPGGEASMSDIRQNSMWIIVSQKSARRFVRMIHTIQQGENFDVVMLVQRECDGVNDQDVSATEDGWANVAIVAGSAMYWSNTGAEASL